MLGKKTVSFKKLGKKVKNTNTEASESHHESLLGESENHTCQKPDRATRTPTGSFAVYVGEDRERFFVPTSFLSHPLFKMLLEKSHNEFCCFDQKNRLVVACSVSTFQEVVTAVESSSGKFDFGDLVEEFI